MLNRILRNRFFIYMLMAASVLLLNGSDSHASTAAPTATTAAKPAATTAAKPAATTAAKTATTAAQAATTAAATTAAQTASTQATTEAVSSENKIRICIDPGHGGNDSGAYYKTDSGKKVHEKTVNLKIGKYLKAALEQYDGVEVTMTRSTDKYLDLNERTEIAMKNNADILISLHCNSNEGGSEYCNGCSIAVAKGSYKEDISLETQKLGCNLLYELTGLGLKNQGLLMRTSQEYTYDNGKAADYYANIRKPLENDIIAVIVEHAFLDNEDDYYDFLCSNEQLQKLGEADARAIARYLQVSKTATGEMLPALTDYKASIYWIKKSSNKRFKKTFYTAENSANYFADRVEAYKAEKAAAAAAATQEQEETTEVAETTEEEPEVPYYAQVKQGKPVVHDDFEYMEAMLELFSGIMIVAGILIFMQNRV